MSIFGLAFTQSLFAQFISGYCDCCEKKWACECYQDCYQKEKITIDTNKTGIIRTIKKVDTDSGTYEFISTISDIVGNLVFTERYIWKEGKLVQMIYNGTTSNIVNFPDPCYFAVVEPSGDSIFFRLDPKSEYPLPKDDIAFVLSKVSSEYKFVKDTSDKYHFIKRDKHLKCKSNYE
jgi:hypothetical protein